jgi:hypothetical protein
MPGYITYNKNEGSLINYTLYASNVEDGTQLYYDVVSVASQNSSVTLNPSSLSVNESETISFSGSVVGIADNTNFYYEITGTVNASDFVDGSLTGIATVSNGIYTITKTLLAFDTDLPEETQENFQLTLRTGSNIGTIVATSSTVYVNNIGFTSFTFNSGGSVGPNGPTAQTLKSSYNTSTYPWLNSTTYFNATDGIQLWTVPRTGTYRIVAAGAKGADEVGAIGGLGAIMQGDFSLVANQKIKIAVGQTSNSGGGTFVVRNTVGVASTSDILVIAGGGGAGHQYAGSQPQFSNATLSDPSNSSASWPFYTGDNTQASGGNGGGSFGGCGGGGGFLTDGATGGLGQGGKSFLNGLTGPAGGSFTSPGAFGGGAGARYSGPGGGGFSGGGGAGSSGGGGTGGGGSSLNNGTNQSNSIGNTGSGYVIITKL